MKNLYKLLSINLLILLSFQVFAQKKVVLVEDRTSPIVEDFYQLLEKMPKEVLFGVDIHDDGNIYVSITNRHWFKKLFTLPKDGIAIDLVVKDYLHPWRVSPLANLRQHSGLLFYLYIADIQDFIVSICFRKLASGVTCHGYK